MTTARNSSYTRTHLNESETARDGDAGVRRREIEAGNRTGRESERERERERRETREGEGAPGERGRTGKRETAEMLLTLLEHI